MRSRSNTFDSNPAGNKCKQSRRRLALGRTVERNYQLLKPIFYNSFERIFSSAFYPYGQRTFLVRHTMPVMCLQRQESMLFLVLHLLLHHIFIPAYGINHWILQNDGRITQKVDSAFLLREPHNLVAFLDQIRHNDYVEQSYLKLRRQRELIAEHLRYSKQFSEDLVVQAERLQPHLGPQAQPMQNLINSLEALTKQTAKMYSYLEFVKDELKEFRKLKTQITQHHEKLIQQQIPLASRQLDEKSNNEDLLKRGQYCSTRTLSNTEDPVLFCDFYSDMQMRLEGKDVDPEALERDWQLTSESVLNQVTNLNVQQRINLEQIKAMRAKKAAVATSIKEKKAQSSPTEDNVKDT